VDLDSLSEAGRNHYFFARSMVGAELTTPTVVPTVASEPCVGADTVVDS